MDSGVNKQLIFLGFRAVYNKTIFWICELHSGKNWFLLLLQFVHSLQVLQLNRWR